MIASTLNHIVLMIIQVHYHIEVLIIHDYKYIT